jgi:LysM repeat protein
MFEFDLLFVSGGVFNYLIRTVVRIPSPRRTIMSTVSLASNNVVLQGFSSPFTSSTNPSGASLTRRGRLARTLFVASLTVVLVAGFAAQSGAGDEVVATTSYVSVVVPGGETLWSVASAYASGDVQAMVEAIREANNLKGYDVQAGQKLRIPSQG